MEDNSLQERQQTLAEKLKARASHLEKRKLEEIVIILIDSSGSMGDHCKNGQTKMEAVKQSVPYLQARGSYVEYGMVKFDSHAQPIQHPTTSFSAILIQLDAFQPGASTNIPDALRVGLEMFHERQVEKKRMVLLSDGQNMEETNYLDGVVGECVKVGVIVDCISFGENADINLLKSIATRTGGIYQHANSPLALMEAYKSLNYTIRYLDHKKEL